jgi:MFS superfamily sulfate permease-like transporter
MFQPRIGKRLPVPLPIELLTVIAGTLVSMFFNLTVNHNVTVVGEVPTG